jgi:hypothetical protein
MKFFTPDLIECFGSDDYGVALTAQTQLRTLGSQTCPATEESLADGRQRR